MRVNDDRPISHSFEDLAVAADGTVLVAWIDSREGPSQTATCLGRVTERGSRLERITRLPAGETCAAVESACRPGPARPRSVLWRKVFPGDIRDMVLSRSTDGGRTVRRGGPRARRSMEDHRLPASRRQHRGRCRAAVSTRSGTPKRPRDRPTSLLRRRRRRSRLARPGACTPRPARCPITRASRWTPAGRGVVVWEDSTAVRRRILLRSIGEGGRSLGPVQVLSQAIKAWTPDVAVARDGFVVAWHEEQFPATKTIDCAT